jgi:hypothetical protein
MKLWKINYIGAQMHCLIILKMLQTWCKKFHNLQIVLLITLTNIYEI